MVTKSLLCSFAGSSNVGQDCATPDAGQSKDIMQKLNRREFGAGEDEVGWSGCRQAINGCYKLWELVTFSALAAIEALLVLAIDQSRRWGQRDVGRDGYGCR